MWAKILLVTSCLIQDIEGRKECTKPHVPSNGFLARCTNGVAHMSVCSVICEPGYNMNGDSRMLCWCGTRSCIWRGTPPTCEEPLCEKPEFEMGRVVVADRWPNGFMGLMEMRDINEYKAKITSGWSLVLKWDQPLGPDALLESWNAEVTSSTYDHQTFTFANMEHNSDLSASVNDRNMRWAFKVGNLVGEPPVQAYVGLFDHRVADANCYKPPHMTNISSLDSILNEQSNEISSSPAYTEQKATDVDTTIPSTTIQESTKVEITTPVPITAASPQPPTTTPTLTIASTATTKASTTKPPQTKKKPRKRKPKNKRKNKGKNKITTAAPSSDVLVTTPEPPSVDTITAASPMPITATALKIGGRFCKLQTHKESYKTQEGWEDLGQTYFSGNAILNVTRHLLDWTMVMIFDYSIDEIQVWSAVIKEKSSNGKIWTFGPHDWNTDLYAGLSDINFIAKPSDNSIQTSVAKVYLCSLAFNEDDAIATGAQLPDEEQRNLVVIEVDPGKVSEPNESTINTSTDSGEAEKKPKLDAENVPRWKKPEKIAKRCLAASPNGIVPKKQSQTKLDFKPNDDTTKYNYNEILHKSILFYEAQRAGKLPKNNRIPWRGHSTLKDGCDIGVDLSGGWFDAGDHVKFSLPMASSLSLLAWGGLLFEDAYKDADELEALRNCIKWPAKFLIKSHISKYEFVGQVGSGKIDHVTHGRPEEMRMKRPTFVLSPEKPGSEPTAEAAAALSATSLFMKSSNKLFAKSALKHAEELFEFADKYRAAYHDSIEDVKDFYFSFSGYKDELVWSAAWLYKATKKQTYLDKAKSIIVELGGEHLVEAEISWDRKIIAAQILLANLTGDNLYRKPVSGFLQNIMNAPKTPKGLMWMRRWGPNRYAANAAFMVLAASTLHPPLPDIDKYVEWARKQIHLILGDIGRSYVVGIGNNYPTRIHHRSSACRPFPAICNRQTFYTPQPNFYVLHGAVVGGPDKTEQYTDNRIVYEQTEVACDYNAGFQSAVAGLKHIVMKNRIPAIAYVDHDLSKWSG